MKNRFALTLTMLLVSANSLSAVVTFNGTASDGGYQTLPGVYTEAGFTMTNDSGSNFFVDNDFRSPEISAFDDDVLEFNTTGSQVTFTESSGSAFDFLAVELGGLNTTSGDAQLTFTGFFSGGGSITQNVDTFAGDYNLISFSGFVGLSSLAVSAPSDGRFPVIDNVVLNAVPVPAAVWLFGSALAGLGWLGRRQTA